MKMNKTVVITGGAKGIGRQISIDFSHLGYNVVIGYNKSQDLAIELTSQLRKHNPNVIAIKADLNLENEAKNLILSAIDQFGHVDVLINNAAISNQKLFTDITKFEWDMMFSINLGGCFICTQKAVKDMLKRKKGKIINISSIWGLTGAACEVHYSSTKAAMIGFTKALAKELGPSGIQVNCVAPGVIDTDMNRHLDKDSLQELINETPMCRLGTPQDVSKTVLFLASEDSDFITGQVISPNGGFLI